MMLKREERLCRTPMSLSGAVLASAAAGPLFLVGLMLGFQATTPAAVIAISPDISAIDILAVIVGIPTALVTVMLIGIAIALIPTMVGTAVMIRLGDVNPAFRLPIMWALAGALPCALFMALDFGEAPILLVALTFTGACCALICRYRVQY